MEDLKTVVFKIGEELYGMDINKVQGIENVVGVTRVPNTAEYIKGIINLRGEIIPVYSLRKKFGLPDLNKEDLQLIVVNLDQIRIAIEIDAIDVIQNVEEVMLHSIPSIVKTPTEQYYEHVLSVDGRIIVIIDPAKLMSDEEKIEVEAIVNQNNEQ